MKNNSTLSPAELRKMAAMLEQQQYGNYPATHHTKPKKRKHSQAPARRGFLDKLMNYIIAAGALFLIAMFISAQSPTPATGAPVREVDLAALDAKYEAAEALRKYLESPAYNYNGKEVGTVEQAIRRFGCGGFYKPLCKEAARLEAVGGAS